VVWVAVCNVVVLQWGGFEKKDAGVFRKDAGCSCIEENPPKWATISSL